MGAYISLSSEIGWRALIGRSMGAKRDEYGKIDETLFWLLKLPR